MGGLDPSSLAFVFLGRPNFQSRGLKILMLKGFGASGRKIGVPPKREIQPRRIQPPILGPLKHRQVAGLDVTDLVFLGLRIPFRAADALWRGVTHIVGQMFQACGQCLGADRAL